ncbi:hypothetical protein G5C66_10615 [Nocardioides sp. KC13]|uniref:Uncharacterized protein n=1 Tax=Nocardioides turkmenicus TaxID=2711220 RepID=A0A6M1QZD4_9ACTN|nr:hypothetical protein [Nocardioides sp. KC13]NGN93186.1 hypothetical protein [Nocardioides sp. KC13]
MTVQRVERDEVVTSAEQILGLDNQGVDLLSLEGLCASLRRAASFLCPASPRQIVDAVRDVLAPLSSQLERDALTDALDALVTSGDLLELRQPGGRTRQLFLGPPSFVEKHAGEYLLLGIRPRNAPLVDESSELEVIYDAHTRSVLVDPASGEAALLAAGLHRLTREQWTKAPRREAPSDVVEEVHRLLSAEQATPGAISGLSIIDPGKVIQFYKGRWREPTSDDNGLFVGRRPQAYGAPIWCVVDLSVGVPQAVLDLPINSNVAPGWDDARGIQAALDAGNNTPQQYRVRQGAQGGTTFDFFAPLPTWAERYLAISGWPAPKGPKSLFSYCLPAAAVDDAQQFLSASLWMTALKEDH